MPNQIAITELSLGANSPLPQGIRRPLLRWVFQALPWVLLASFLEDSLARRALENIGLNVFFLGTGTDIRFAIPELASALAIFVFLWLLRRLPETFATLWTRNCIALGKSNGKAVQRDSSSSPNIPDRALLRDQYVLFLQNVENALNHRASILFGIAVAGLLNLRYLTDCVTWNVLLKLITNPCASLLDVVYQNGVGFVVGLMLWRLVVLAVKIAEIARRFELHVQFAHPDRCGGLEPLGNLCLLNALIISIYGIMIGLLLFIEIPLGSPHQLFFLSLLVVPVTLAPLVFILPLWNIHRVMREKKAGLRRSLDELGAEIDALAMRLVAQVDKVDPDESGKLIKKLESMQQIYRANQKIPTWPFNTTILAQLATAQLVPLLSLTGIADALFKFFASLLNIPTK